MKKLIYLSVVLFSFYGINIFAQRHVDPEYIQVVSAENPITVDGKLDERDWSQRRYDYLVFSEAESTGDVVYYITDTVYVKGVPVDTTTTIVKILHYGLDLYISLDSDDKSVCKWGGSWEGDGLFMKIKNKQGVPKEFKLYFNAAGTDPDIVFETNADVGAGDGKAYKRPGTVVNDTTQIDSGYTAEMVIHLDKLGFTDPYSNLSVIMNIFDPDGYTSNEDAWLAPYGSYFKSYWGSEWGLSESEFRTLRLADPPVVNAYKVDQNVTLDGKLDEALWGGPADIVIGRGSNQSTGGWYMQWKNEGNTYTDQSKASIKLRHKGTDLYIGVESDDKSICKWSPGWESDGLFVWMTNKGEVPAGNQRMEIHLMYAKVDSQGAEFMINDNVPMGSAEGASYLFTGSIAHDPNGEDNGYSLEFVIHTDYFGYADGDTVMLSLVSWDMDYAEETIWNADTLSDYAPNWWGTQWVDPGFEKYYMYRGVVLSNLTDVKDVEYNPTVQTYKLEQNYPNPFNPSTKITYSIPKSSNVSLIIYDVLGNQVETLVNGVQNAGTYTLDWDASNYTTGVYFYQIKTDNFVSTKKMILMK